VALLPAPTVAREVLGGSLKAIALSGQQLSRPLGIIYRSDRELGHLAKSFVALLESHARDSHDDIAPAAVAATTNNHKPIHD
jgi:DNA-binding transcriptional LysR family regulator